MAVDCPACPVATAASVKEFVARKSPSKKSHDSPAAFSSSPMLGPDMATASRVEQSSQYGWASPVTKSHRARRA